MVDRETSELPPVVTERLRAELGDFVVVADTSWPRQSSRVWLARWPTHEAYVKISPSEESFARERAALRSTVPAAGVAAPSLLASFPELRVLVLTVVPGLVVRTMSPAPDRSTEREIHWQAGATLAAVHRQHQARDHGDEVDPILESVLCLSTVREELSRRVLTVAQRHGIARARGTLASSASARWLTLTHGDFQPRNWLWSEPDSQLGLIDFEASHVGLALEDFAWLFATVWPDRPDLRASFLHGYGAVLTPRDERFLAAFTILGSLEHVADGVRLQIPLKVENGLRALEVGVQALETLGASGPTPQPPSGALDVIASGLGHPPAEVREWLLSPRVRHVAPLARRLRSAAKDDAAVTAHALPPADLPLSAGYDVQRLTTCARILSGAVPVGYKVGLTSEAVRRQYGIDTPDRGVIFDQDLVPTGTTLPASAAVGAKLEVEIALVVERVERSGQGWTLVPRGGFLCFEILRTRYCSWQGTVAQSVADNAALGTVVVGPPLASVDAPALLRTAVTVRRAGAEVAQGGATALDGGPWGSARWLLDSLGAVDRRLQPGDVILTGALAPVIDIAPGDEIEAVSDDGGVIRVAFAGENSLQEGAQ